MNVLRLRDYLSNGLLALLLTLGLIQPSGSLLTMRLMADEFEEDEDEEEEVAMPSTKEVYAFLKEKFPEAYRELILARDEDPVDEFQGALSRAAEFVFEYREIEQDDPAAAVFFLAIERERLKAYGISDRYHAANSSTQRQSLRAKLKEAASRLFELQIKEQEHELKRLRDEIEDLGGMIKERKANQEEEIDEILNELLEIDDEEQPD